ncbi:hypothetical protein IW146_005457 [Coemansia sp. RSA 922]|nr:hypothetical protein GGH13_007791 [Coemansia sp. S155-1]KAJ2066222.1 hypothetical protein GGI08_001972 [Coemansia sp. S2]KAJ2111288.1 hypothetical protein IW146_005457 [Coemansia sp. RSA 922]KAJ2331694.1 hypothetical protein GGH92_009147 [Coemansia sp. RSA 2673]
MSGIKDITFSVTYEDAEENKERKVTVKENATITQLIKACKEKFSIIDEESVGLYDKGNMMFHSSDERTAQAIKYTELKLV